jgi:hypothetical protein
VADLRRFLNRGKSDLLFCAVGNLTCPLCLPLSPLLAPPPLLAPLLVLVLLLENTGLALAQD